MKIVKYNKIYEKQIFFKNFCFFLISLISFANYSNLLSVKKAILLFVAIVFIYVYTNAATYYSIGNVNWSNTTTWTSTGVSGSGDIVYIDANTITLDDDIENLTVPVGIDVSEEMICDFSVYHESFITHIKKDKKI